MSNDTWTNPDDGAMATMIRETKTIAVVGLSSKVERPSNEVARYLHDHGYTIIPVNPMESEILGEKSYPDLKSIDRQVDMVDIFRKGEATPPIVREALEIGAKYIWLQLGVISQESYDLARKADIPIVMDRCILQEHKRLGV